MIFPTSSFRRVREGRAELRKFLRDVKRQNPAANTVLQYDKLFVNHRCYVFSDIQGKVVEYSPVATLYLFSINHINKFNQGDIDPGIGRPGSVLARSSSVMSMAGGGQGPAPAMKRRAPASGMWRSQSCLSDLDQEPGISQVRLSIFSCEDAAQQVLMSFCLSVCLSVVNLKIYLPTSFYNI